MKKVLITGANKGIGLEMARQLSQKGYYVFIGSRNLKSGLDAVELLTSEGLVNIEAIQLDVTDQESINAARNEIGNKTDMLDILINNAGINGIEFQGDIPLMHTALGTGVDKFKEVYDVNVFGVIRTTQAFIDLLQKSPTPRIVNVSSSQGSLTLHSDPEYKYYHAKGAVYQSSKSALNMYTIALAYELRNTDFKVNAVSPPSTATDFNHHLGTGSVEVAAEHILRYALIDNDGPTGKFFCPDNNPETGEIPW
ncbi:NAD(P)-dependent dehydrogenase, short-chain alcohol dehydrogenase family [Chryseobacterium wanjuense]|uniref:NAD(P)-dependent dehydrogenase, short-chain alcohol dehydrogenase family n=1 Tax=Chryseobacterium wanjuense TaxID=356305 RepID=A0A1I0S3I8_9FLAO|nr:SDR family oxidoreductase [Chryseobacterium wanjuense]SEW49281.1 NAD(P)-dependent dehydrogenase, short-chain alcohol dehydrogenase family [Chryseobacterium wanjuense]